MTSWPVGAWLPNPPVVQRDARSGGILLNITRGEGENKPLYFNKRHFTADAARLIFTSNRTGAWQIFAYDVPGQRLCRLTDSPSDPLYPLVDPAEPSVYYVEGARLHRVDIDTAQDEVVYEHPNRDFSMFRLQDVSADGKFIGLAEIGRYPGDDIDESVAAKFHRRYNARPWSRFWIVSRDGSRSWMAREDARYLYHLQFNPVDPSLILYCHEGPAASVGQRMWLMKWDGSENRPLRVQDRPGITICHEFWKAVGRSVVYLHQSPPTNEPWSVREIPVDGGEERTLVVHPLHDIALQGRWLVGDDPQRLWLFNLDSGDRTALIEHGQDIGMENQPFHPHAQFSPDGRYVDVSYKREGANDVVLIPIELG